MKLTGELKEKVANAESAEQVKELIAEAGVELTDEEVASVAGGAKPRIVIPTLPGRYIKGKTDPKKGGLVNGKVSYDVNLPF